MSEREGASLYYTVAMLYSCCTVRVLHYACYAVRVLCCTAVVLYCTHQLFPIVDVHWYPVPKCKVNLALCLHRRIEKYGQPKSSVCA